MKKPYGWLKVVSLILMGNPSCWSNTHIYVTRVFAVIWVNFATMEMKCVWYAKNVTTYLKWIAFSFPMNQQTRNHESRAEIFLLRPMHPQNEE